MLGHQFSKNPRGLESRSLHTSPSVPLAAVEDSVSIGRGTSCYHENLRVFPLLGAHLPLEIRPQWWLIIPNLRPYFLKGEVAQGLEGGVGVSNIILLQFKKMLDTLLPILFVTFQFLLDD